MGDAAKADIEAAFERLLSNPLQTDEWRVATAWIVDMIGVYLGADWFSRALHRDDPLRDTVFCWLSVPFRG